MTTISAKVIADSISCIDDTRLTTMQLRYPRFIHAEFITHRMFSGNASASRAIPVSRLMADIRADPAEPIFWGSAQPGMQAGANLWGHDLASAKAYWREDREHSITMAEAMAGCNAAKQLVNRLIENHGHINVVCSATEWKNFFFLRDHKAAEPHIAELARQMMKAYNESEPEIKAPGQWHTPYMNPGEGDTQGERMMGSVARCARVSYMTHEGKTPELDADFKLAQTLVGSTPKHASPAEHQATPLEPGEGEKRRLAPGLEPEGNWCRNYNGWKMFRAMISEDTIHG